MGRKPSKGCALNTRSLSLIAVALVVGARMGFALPPQFNTQEFKLAVQEVRPMAKAAELMAQKYGIRITYEDLPLIEYSQLQKPGIISISLPSPRSVPPPRPIDIVQLVLDNYAKNGNPGVFRVKENDGAFQIIPAMIIDSRGRALEAVPILDAHISFPSYERNGFDTLQTIANAVSLSAGIKVNFGLAPYKWLMQQKLTIGANNEVARDVLLRALDSTGAKLIWWLLYDPHNRSYGLSIDAAMVEEKTPTGRTRLRRLP